MYKVEPSNGRTPMTRRSSSHIIRFRSYQCNAAKSLKGCESQKTVYKIILLSAEKSSILAPLI